MANQRKNSSHYPHFLRIILPHNLQNESSLELPRKFVKKHGKRLQKHARLKLPTGTEYKMKVKKLSNKRAWLCKGWPDFVSKHSIQTGYFLVFRYIGGSRFRVRIYDLTTSEINYYPPLMSDKHIHVMEEEDMKEAPNQIEKFNPFKSNKSSFTVVMRKSYVDYFYMLHVPEAHSRRYLRDEHGKQAFLVVHGRDQDDETWPVKIYEQSGTRFTSGWKDFVEANDLQRGDSCEFELLRRKPNYYKVHIFRIAESP